ncbi:ovarian carcinoma immunoreactive antigen (OCIA) domain-containing protein [Phthorimaea operculella]|nr:ovarian carcinoma immunoreactive antigen (OCIA) domain-containing protein [Phthorimaea operculella]
MASRSTYEDGEYVEPGAAPTPMPGAPQPGGGFPSGYKFTPDELRVLGECNRESFFQRSLPLGTAMGFTTFIAIQKGHLKPNPRFGVIPKVTLAVVMGYFIGKLSYQEACAEKLMALPGSYIGQLLKERKEGKVKGTGMTKHPNTMFGANSNDIYSDAGPGSSLDLDTNRPLFNEDSYQPGSDLGTAPADESRPPVRPTLSYEELRRQNRSQYYESKQDPYRVDPNTVPPPPVRPAPAPRVNKPTNKYGDDME